MGNPGRFVLKERESGSVELLKERLSVVNSPAVHKAITRASATRFFLNEMQNFRNQA